MRILPRITLLVSFMLALTTVPGAHSAPVHLVDQAAARITEVEPGVFLVDFERVAFGNVRLKPPANATDTITIHFGEALSDGRIDRTPPGTVRYAVTSISPDGSNSVVAAPPADKRNTNQPKGDLTPAERGVVLPAILTPPEWGVVMPFRWVEITGWHGELHLEQITRQAAFAAAWDDDAASFHSSDDMLNRIWELSRYSIKATTFAGLYVDGDRERIPYEADAYLNQLSHYTTDNDIQFARDTFDWLVKYPTWPTEWGPHMVFIAYADWMHTGDAEWLAPRYEILKSKLLLDRVGPDGLITSNAEQIGRTDIVDWPRGERDGYVFTPRNTVVNAFHLHAIGLMAELAQAVGNKTDSAEYAAIAQTRHTEFQNTFFDADLGAYRDGIDTDHTALHASLFPLAFDLVPEPHKIAVTDWVAGRGMACSVYAAQYLLEALFENGAAGKAIQLITAPGDRSWRHMVESGTTISWEAWDQRYKPNQDWNHAWGAAPANLLPRFVLGAQPLTPGWQRALIRPRTGNLMFAGGKVPTPRGPIEIEWSRGATFRLSLSLPPGVSARIELPATGTADAVLVDSQPVAAYRVSNYWILQEDVVGTVNISMAVTESFPPD